MQWKYVADGDISALSTIESMPGKYAFEHLYKNITKYETDVANYLPPQIVIPSTGSSTKQEEAIADDGGTEQQTTVKLKEREEKRPDKGVKAELPGLCALENLAVFQKFPQLPSPKLCTWAYMNKTELKVFMGLESKSDIRKSIETTLGDHQKGFNRIITRELIYTVTKFCKNMQFNLEQTGSILSIFYRTHCFFTSSFFSTAEKVYKYFKDHLLLHSLEFPPASIKIFTYKESRKAILFFCNIYLRNLPLVRLLSLPNYGFHLDYKLEPDPVFGKGKKKKEKKEKKEKKAKKGKKGKK